MAQRLAAESKVAYWEAKGYKIVDGAELMGRVGTERLILMEKEVKEEAVTPTAHTEVIKKEGKVCQNKTSYSQGRKNQQKKQKK